VKLDLDGLDIGGDPAEFARQIQERLAAAGEDFQRIANGETPPPKKRQRKPTRAQLERERRAREVEEAKTRDFKSLYKQLAKVLHPDLETDPVLKEHKEVWMKRLTAAHANRDLRDLLAIELEWLGEEAGNLAKAGDEKLRVYAMVLKEQAMETRERTRMLHFEPRYQALERFADPFGGPLRTAAIRANLIDEATRLGEMIERLKAGGADARRMIGAWADAHARACQRR
jgi:hypothetical protein